MQMIVDSLLVNYQQHGKGSKGVLLIHGWGDNIQTFDNLQKFLRKKYTVLLLDLPGMGASQPPESVWDLDNYASFIDKFIQKAWGKPLHAIIGHSNGGAIALRGLGQGKLKADKLVLLSSAGIRSNRQAKKLALKFVAKAGKVATIPLPRKARERIRRKFYGQIGSDMLVMEHLQQTFKKVVNQDIQADARGLSLPTLLIYGERDTDTPPNYGKVLSSAISGSELQVLRGAGHFVHHDQPNQVDKLIGDFLA